MADTGPVGGAGSEPQPLSPHDRKLYEQEYNQGVDLFQRALNEYSNSGEYHKKAAFQEVMDRAMQVLNETARELKRPDLITENDKISKDYQTYQDDQTDLAKKQLAKDLKEAKDML